ncbi:MAG: D-alanyl-D-alanine carboxypeptidase family protein [Clostridia bacterium]|nr:D-alanyl-D-alanine carboxypeptidase family protein [Clostridia bacterium]
MKKQRRNGAFVAVALLTLALALLAWICLRGSGCQAREAQAKLDQARSEARAEIDSANAQIEQDNAAEQARYDAEVAEYRAALAENQGKNVSWPQPAGQGWEVVDLTGFEVDDPTYVNISRQDMLYNGLLVVNRWHERPSDFDESKVLNIHSNKKEIPLADHTKRMLPAAIEAWASLLGDMKTQFQWDYIILDNTFRSYDKQKELYDEAAKKLSGKYSDPDELRAAVVASNTSYPGTSEYNTGLSAAARIYKNGTDAKTVGFAGTLDREEGKWIYDHSWEYGLVFRFPMTDFPYSGIADRSHLTGITGKQYLFRYVGKAHAAAMHALGDLCLEEYIDYLSIHPHIAVYENGDVRYEIWREAVPNAVTVRVTHSGKKPDTQQESFLDNLTYFDSDNIEWAFVVTALTY